MSKMCLCLLSLFGPWIDVIYHELPPFIQDHVVLNCQPALKCAPIRPALPPSFFEDAAQFMAPLLFIFAMSQFLPWLGRWQGIFCLFGVTCSPVAVLGVRTVRFWHLWVSDHLKEKHPSTNDAIWNETCLGWGWGGQCLAMNHSKWN